MKRIVCAIGFCLLAGSAIAQKEGDVTISLTTGRAGFSFEQMKNETYQFQQQLEVETKITDNYPSYYNYGGQISYRLNPESSVGLVVSTTSTGSRISYSDYSGKILFDQLVKGTQIGANATHNFTQKGFLILVGGLQASILISNLQMDYLFEVGSEKESFNERFSAVGYSIDPTLGLVARFSMFHLGLRAGYCLSSSGPFKWTKDKRATYQDSAGKDMHPEWSGMRIGLSMGITFPYSILN